MWDYGKPGGALTRGKLTRGKKKKDVIQPLVQMGRDYQVCSRNKIGDKRLVDMYMHL